MSNPLHAVPAEGAAAAASSEVYDLAAAAEAMRLLSERMTEPGEYPLEHLVAIAVETVGGARWASITVNRGGRLHTSVSSAAEAELADTLQYELGSGPCVDAVLEGTLYVVGDVRRDTRWARWGRRASTETGVRSVLSQHFLVPDQDGVDASLNIYSDREYAFDRASVGVALMVATHGAQVLSGLLASHRAHHLSQALQTNRDIGVAMGIVMQQRRLTRQQAFDVLRVASQNSNRKLVEIAREVAGTGTLTIAQPDR